MIDPRDLDTNGLLREMLNELQTIRVLLEERLTDNRVWEPPCPAPIIAEKPRCSKCGMQLDGVMGYVCSDVHCPTFPKVTC